MPLVEMRRTTRIFGARVLRSGRRLFSNPEVIKNMRRAPLAVVEDDWIELIDHGKENGNWNSNEEKGKLKLKLKPKPQKFGKLGESKEIGMVERVDESKRWGLVYSRKRKRNEVIDASECEKFDKKFGKKFSRKQNRKNIELPELPPVVIDEPASVVLNSKARKKTGVKSVNVSVPKPNRLNLRNLPSRKGVNGVSIHRGIRKRRSSLILRKKRNPASFGLLKSGNGFQDGVQFFPKKPDPEVSRLSKKTSFKVLKSSLEELTQNIDSVSCNASILVIESDRCYREHGGVITMEISDSNQWFLVVKRNGVERFRVDARNVMRPCFINRITHTIIWASSDESWRLEFPERQDWFIFKELYRKCSERALRVKPFSSSIIPVPRVNEVSGYSNENYTPFKMPDSYISFKGDEVSRVLEKSDSVYDMDSDDDEWLNMFNDKRDAIVDENTFEKIIDAFERGIYSNPEEFSDATVAVDRCLMIASKEVLEAVYDYWMIKRKKKHSALVHVFQLYKPRKPEQLNIKAVIRRKRSFRKRANQFRRGKQITFLKAEEANKASNKVTETKDAADDAAQTAIAKRQRAQLLMEVADLLTYKAAMALKIAQSRATSGGSVNDGNFTEEYFFSGE